MDKIIDRIKKIIYQYEDKIPKGLEFYYEDILNGNNLEEYEKTFGISKEELFKYARICRIIAIYKDVCDLVDILDKEADILEQGELLGYQENLSELEMEGEEFLSIIEDEEEEMIDYGNSTNIIIYSDHINESKERTKTARSGKIEQTQKAIATLINQLRSADYQSLRKKGYIHQNQVMGSNEPCYFDGKAFERTGRGSTKVNYIRISVSENNRNKIKEYLNIDFDTVFLVVNYGDFKNEGIDELKYFNEVYLDLKRHSREILEIINIFKNDFTPQTFEEAIQFITKGFKITEEITSIMNPKNI